MFGVVLDGLLCVVCRWVVSGGWRVVVVWVCAEWWVACGAFWCDAPLQDDGSVAVKRARAGRVTPARHVRSMSGWVSSTARLRGCRLEEGHEDCRAFGFDKYGDRVGQAEEAA